MSAPMVKGLGIGVKGSRLRGQGVKGLEHGIALSRQLLYRTVFGRGRAGI